MEYKKIKKNLEYLNFKWIIIFAITGTTQYPKKPNPDTFSLCHTHVGPNFAGPKEKREDEGKVGHGPRTGRWSEKVEQQTKTQHVPKK